jgi:tryptophanyl-tRNA synthetase
VKKRVLSGYRATGSVHIGNLFGTLEAWVKCQSDYDCFFEVADLHALTTSYSNVAEMKLRTREMAADWMACGIRPEQSTIFIQSLVPEHSELHLLFSMLVPVPWLERNPTLKDQVRDLNLQNKMTYGLLGYPVLQAADILSYKANAVPVGEDQLPHLEITRQIARRFNSIYKPVFPEPDPLLSKSPKVPGIDGKKMSKSLDNAILVNESPAATKEKVFRSFTDPAKIHKHDKGHPEGCIVFAYHQLVNPQGIKELRHSCTQGKLGCVECKERTTNLLNELLAGYRESRNAVNEKTVDEILIEGSKKARKTARETLDEVKDVMNLWEQKLCP